MSTRKLGGLEVSELGFGNMGLSLTPADLREIETAFSRIEIYGGRMDARQMAQIGKDGE